MKPEKVTVGTIPGPPTQFLPFFVAQERGLFSAPDVNIEVSTVVSGAIDVLRNAIASGEIDFGLYHLEHVLIVSDKGKPTLSIVSMMNYPSSVLAVKTGLLPGLENEKDPKKIITALKGLRIGTISAPALDTIWFRHLAKRHAGLTDGKDYTFVHLGTTAQTYEAALKRGEVDAIFTVHPYPAPLIYKGLARIVAFQWDFPEYAPGRYQATTVITVPEHIQRRRDVVARFVKAIVRAERWMNDNPQEVVAIGRKLYPDWPADYAAMILPKYRWTPLFTREAVENVITTYVEERLISKKLPWDSVTTNDFAREVQ
jgi:ABC-type nitrate/sulfonate/bicarbonate transport system substrate-binding protein